MGRKLADASASKRACALVSAARCESRFRACHHVACMRIVMATHDRPADVTAESSDVSGPTSAVRGTRIDVSKRADVSQHAQHRQCSAACPEIRGSPPSSLGHLSFKLQRGPSQTQLPGRSKEACRQAKEQERRFSGVSARGGLATGQDGSQWRQHRQEENDH